jgi:hypothetical protein
METDQEYRSRLAVHPDFPKDEPYTLGKLAVAEGLSLDLVGRQLTPPCPRVPFDTMPLGQAAEDIEAGQAVTLGPDGKVRVAREAYASWQFDGNKVPEVCGQCGAQVNGTHDCSEHMDTSTGPDTMPAPGGAP